MHYAASWLEAHLETRLPQPAADVDVFPVEEEALVPPSDALEGASPDEPHRAGNPLDRAWSLVDQRIANHLICPRRVWEDPVEEQRLSVGGAEARKPSHGELQRTVLLHDPRRYQADGRVIAQDTHELDDRGRFDASVRVEKQRVGR